MNPLPTTILSKASRAIRDGVLPVLAGTCLLFLSGGSTAQTPAPPVVPAAPAAAPAASAPDQITWEYRVENVTLANRALETQLNLRGAEGWELISVSVKGVAIFKRPKK